MVPSRRRGPVRIGQRLAVVVGLLPWTVAACKDATPGWQFDGYVSRSRFWEYHDRSAEPLCPGLLDLLDQHALTVGAKLGLTVEEDRPLRYYRFQDKADLTSGCPAGVVGCSNGDAVLTAQPFHAHEQVHAYVSRAWGTLAVGLLAEGEAVALSCEPLYQPVAGRTPREALVAADWRRFLYLDGNSNPGYSAAGFWVTYLARRFGWGKVEELHHRALLGLSPDDFAVEFARVFPLSMDDAWAEALGGKSPPCDSEWRCHSTPWQTGEAVEPSCDGELHRTIAVTNEPGIVLAHRPPVLLQDCDDPLSPVSELIPGRYRTTSWVPLAPGRYTVSGEYALSSEVTFVSYLPSPLFAADCAQAAKVTLAAGQTTMVDLLPGTIDGCLRLDGGGRSYSISVWYLEAPETGGVTLCDSSGAQGVCVLKGAYGSTTFTLGADATIHLQDVQSAPPASRSWGEIMFYPASTVDAGP